MLAATAALATAGPAAQAQSSVSVFGLIDIGFVRESGGSAGTLNKFTGGMSNGSRLGFRGSETLGDGWSAVFLLESGFQPDTGAMGQGGVLLGRQAYAGLRTPHGTLTFGRQYTSHFNALVLADPFSSGLAGDAKNLMPSTGDAATRMNNSVKFASNDYRGFSGELMHAPGEVAGGPSRGRQWAAALAYGGGPLHVRLGYHYRNNDTALAHIGSGRTALLAATWQAGPVKVHGGYGVNQGINSSPLRNTSNPYGLVPVPVASTDSVDVLLGLSSIHGLHTFLASYVGKDDRTQRDQDARQLALGHRYALSKRTDTYVSLAHIRNRKGASYTVGSSIEAGSGDRAVSAGFRHVF